MAGYARGGRELLTEIGKGDVFPSSLHTQVGNAKFYTDRLAKIPDTAFDTFPVQVQLPVTR